MLSYELPASRSPGAVATCPLSHPPTGQPVDPPTPQPTHGDQPNRQPTLGLGLAATRRPVYLLLRRLGGLLGLLRVLLKERQVPATAAGGRRGLGGLLRGLLCLGCKGGAKGGATGLGGAALSMQ